MAADGARAARARQVAHRGRAERVESCRRTEHARISKGAGREGRVESVRGRLEGGGQWAMVRVSEHEGHLLALQGVRRHQDERAGRATRYRLTSARQGFGRRAILAGEAMIRGFYGCIRIAGAHSRQSEPCNLVRTAPRKALTSPSRTTVRGANGRTKSLGAGRKRGRSSRPFRDTRCAAQRPDMARAVSTARASIAAVSDPFATEVDHGGVTESPLGPVLLCPPVDVVHHPRGGLDPP